MPAVIDLDELETGERREGIIYSFFIFFEKMGLSLALAGSNYILALVGYVSTIDDVNITQPPSVILALRIMESIVPLVL